MLIPSVFECSISEVQLHVENGQSTMMRAKKERTNECESMKRCQRRCECTTLDMARAQFIRRSSCYALHSLRWHSRVFFNDRSENTKLTNLLGISTSTVRPIDATQRLTMDGKPMRSTIS